jgi:TIR domain
MPMNPPKVFISYSHDSSWHKAWVLKLAGDLRAKGVDVVLDRWDLVPGQDVSLFMQRGISQADRVIMVCSSVYVEKAEGGVGGVGFERLIVTAEVIRSIDTIKFIPILRESGGSGKIPSFLGPRLYINFDLDEDYEDRLDELTRVMHGAPATIKPPLGPNPFSGIAERKLSFPCENQSLFKNLSSPTNAPLGPRSLAGAGVACHTPIRSSIRPLSCSLPARGFPRVFRLAIRTFESPIV